MSEHETDKVLVGRARRGDNKAFDLLLLKYQNRVVSVVSRFVYNHSDALDVTQEAFMRAWRALPNFRGESRFYTWLYRIAVNTAKNHLAAAARQPASKCADVSDIERTDSSEALRENATPEALLSRDELQSAVLSAIEELPKELRIAIVQREIDGMSYRQIAELMECPIGTVRSRIFRAREAIDNRIAPLLQGR